MNHVPDAALAAVDDLGEAVLAGDTAVVDERLRSDFRVAIDCDRVALEDREAQIQFRLDSQTPAGRLRDHGSFVGTVVDGIESRLREWGLEPPERYTHAATEEGWQVYTGRLDLP